MKKVTKKELQQIVNGCETKADVCRALELKPTGGNYRIIDNLLRVNDISWTNYKGLHWKLGKKVLGVKQLSIEEICVKNSTYKNTRYLKKRLIESGIKPNYCEICGFSDKVELHHINGDPTDNRLENLQILCPNCHSKTENYRGANINKPTRTHASHEEITLTQEEIEKRELERKLRRRKLKSSNELESDSQSNFSKVKRYCAICGRELNPKQIKYCSIECYRKDIKGNRPTLVQLIRDFEEFKSFTQVGNKYNVTDNSVRKWCKLYGIPTHTKEILEYIKNYNNPDYVIPKEAKRERIYNPDEIIKIYNEVQSIQETAKIKNCDTHTVSKILRKYGIETRPTKRVKQFTKEGKYLTTFNSAEAAAQWLTYHHIVEPTTQLATIKKAIRDCCLGNRKNIYNYNWKYDQ